MRLTISVIPEEVVKQYNLLSLVHNSFVNAFIEKIYMVYLKPVRYHITSSHATLHLLDIVPPSTPLVSSLWIHNTRSLSFVLTIDYFGIKYSHLRDTSHLFAAFHRKYDISTD